MGISNALVKSRANAKRRKKVADYLRDLRSVKTPSLSMRQRNTAIRSHAKQAVRNRTIFK